MILQHPLDFVFNAFTFFASPWLIVGLTLFKLRGRSLPTKLAASSLFFLAALTFFTLGGFVWICRNGWGQDAITSTGTLATKRFIEGFWPFLLFSLACVTSGLWACRFKNPSDI